MYQNWKRFKKQLPPIDTISKSQQVRLIVKRGRGASRYYTKHRGTITFNNACQDRDGSKHYKYNAFSLLELKS